MATERLPTTTTVSVTTCATYFDVHVVLAPDDWPDCVTREFRCKFPFESREWQFEFLRDAQLPGVIIGKVIRELEFAEARIPTLDDQPERAERDGWAIWQLELAVLLFSMFTLASVGKLVWLLWFEW